MRLVNEPRYHLFGKELLTWLVACDIIRCTVQLGYCDSDVTVCLLIWIMPIFQDRDVKFPYKR